MILALLLSLTVSAAPSPKPSAVAPTLRAVGDGKVAALAVGDEVRVAVDDADVRGDPSTDKKPIGKLGFGSLVKIVEVAPTVTTIGKLTQRWYRVSYTGGATPVVGWLFGNTLTPLASPSWTVTFTAEGAATVRFFRTHEQPAQASVDVLAAAGAQTLQAVAGPRIDERSSVVVRACKSDTACVDVWVGQGAAGAAVLASTPSTSSTPLSASLALVDGEELRFAGKPVVLAGLLVPKAAYTDAELVERFMTSCTETVRVTAPGMFDEPTVMPLCEVRAFEQNCSPDSCFSEAEGCLDGCGKTCGTCDSACGAGCSTCMNTCSDDACRRRCAEKRATCLNTCVAAAEQCRSSGCAGVYERCSEKREARIAKECGGREACRTAAFCIANGSAGCRPMPQWCVTECYEQ
jgi:hypothetical protein